tara:strand:+ start:947 stop:1864 length:918 start_codon:yes stop_codon:yes gene_type:complete
MKKQTKIVEDKFDERWQTLSRGYEELKRKTKNENYVVYGDMLYSLVNRALVTNKYIFNNYRKKSKILDIACGNGFNTCFLKKNNYNALGFDYSSIAIFQAEKKAKELKIKDKLFFKKDLNYLKKIKKNSFHVAIALGLTRYLKEKDINLLYKETYRILKKGGIFIVSNDNDLFEMFAMNDGTTKFWCNVINEFSDVKNLLKPKKLENEYGNMAKLKRRKYSKNSVSKFIKKRSENPLTYSNFVSKFGFNLSKISYHDSNVLPPLLENKISDKKISKLKSKVCTQQADNNWRTMFMSHEFLGFLKK